MSRVRFITPMAWAALVLRELRKIARDVREQRREMNDHMANLQEQVNLLSSTMDGILAGLTVVQNEVTELVAEIVALNANTAVDLSPLQTKAQGALDMLSGIQTQAQPPVPAP